MGKENLMGLSAIAIATIVIRVRKVIKQGANAVGSIAKALKNLAKKLGPIIAPLLNLISQIFILGAKGIPFLVKNLLLLAIVLAYFIYDQYKIKLIKTCF